MRVFDGQKEESPMKPFTVRGRKKESFMKFWWGVWGCRCGWIRMVRLGPVKLLHGNGLRGVWGRKEFGWGRDGLEGAFGV